MKLEFNPIYIDYKIVNEKPRIYMYGRSHNKQICVVDDSFSPYFIAVAKDISLFQEKVKRLKLEEEGKTDAFVINTEVIEKKLIGKKIQAVKVFVNVPSSISRIKDVIKSWDLLENVYEYDIPFVNQYLIDMNILPLTTLIVEGEQLNEDFPTLNLKSIEPLNKNSVENKLLAFDIETYNPDGKNILPEEHPILMVALFGKDFKKVLTWKTFPTNETYIEFVSNEKELLQKLNDYIKEYSPDIITGYYSDGFDMPYIMTRAKIHNVKLDFSFDGSTPKKQKGRYSSVDVTGMAHVDLINFIRIIISRSLKTDSLKLNEVASELLGEKKDDVEVEKLAEVWDKGGAELETYCKYNLKDSILTYKLFQKVLPNLEEMVKIIGLPIFEISRMSFSQLVEWYIIRMCKEYNEIVLNKPGYNQTNERMAKRFQGAFVFEPTPGVYENIAVFDFLSLYPTIIISHNVGINSINCDHQECQSEKVPLENEDTWFCKKEKDFVSSILENIISRRSRIKEMLKKEKDNLLLSAKSEALKVLANSFYGYLGFAPARWYSYDSGNSVTAFARYYIKKVIENAKEKGFSVIYGDTDSIFMELKDKTEDEAIKFVDGINATLPGIMELEYEEFYPRGIFVQTKGSDVGAKKRYALLRKDDTLNIKGFETVRRNVSFIAKTVQQNILNMILKEKDIIKAKDYVKQIIVNLKTKNIPVKDLIIYTKLTRKPSEYDSIGPHVAVAKQMENKGIKVGPGSLVGYVITNGTGVLRDRAMLPDDVKDYDSSYYINHQVIPVVEKIFEIFDIDKDELIGEKKQSKLDAFF